MNVNDLNNLELNRACRKLLLDRKISVDSGLLMSLQAVEWGVQNLELIGPWEADQYVLAEQIEAMKGWEPENAQKFLLPLEDPTEEVSVVPETEYLYSRMKRDGELEDLVDVSLILLENLYENLRNINPYFSSPDTSE